MRNQLPEHFHMQRAVPCLCIYSMHTTKNIRARVKIQDSSPQFCDSRTALILYAQLKSSVHRSSNLGTRTFPPSGHVHPSGKLTY